MDQAAQAQNPEQTAYYAGLAIALLTISFVAVFFVTGTISSPASEPVTDGTGAVPETVSVTAVDQDDDGAYSVTVTYTDSAVNVTDAATRRVIIQNQDTGMSTAWVADNQTAENTYPLTPGSSITVGEAGVGAIGEDTLTQGTRVWVIWISEDGTTSHVLSKFTVAENTI